MQAHAFDRYQAKGSFLHKLDPRVKLVGAVFFILSTVLLPDGAWLAFGLSWAFLLVLNRLGRLGWGYTLKRSFLALPFALAAVTVVFTLPGRPLAAFHIFSWNLTITDAGLLRFSSILVRSWLSVQAAILLVALTPFPDLAHALRHLHFPSILVAVISFMVRYLYVLVDEANRLMRARAARSAQLPGARRPSLTWRAHLTGNMAGQLFLRGYERSERVYNAMLARGYTGQFLTLNPHLMQPKDWAALSIFGMLLLALHLLTWLAL